MPDATKQANHEEKRALALLTIPLPNGADPLEFARLTTDATRHAGIELRGERQLEFTGRVRPALEPEDLGAADTLLKRSAWEHQAFEREGNVAASEARVVIPA